MMWEYANGIDEAKVNYKFEKPKGVGNSVTLPMDIGDIAKLEEVLLALTEQVTYRLRQYDLLANVVNVQLRTNCFVDFSHQKKLEAATSNTKEIYSKAKELLKEMYKPNTLIRLVGLRVDSLVSKDEMQLSFFSKEESEKQENIDKVIDDLKNKYGYNKITRAGKMNVNEIVKFKK